MFHLIVSVSCKLICLCQSVWIEACVSITGSSKRDTNYSLNEITYLRLLIQFVFFFSLLFFSLLSFPFKQKMTTELERSQRGWKDFSNKFSIGGNSFGSNMVNQVGASFLTCQTVCIEKYFPVFFLFFF